ncbi:MAG: NUDIX hydrolase [Candidatus Staskawiczbacteria bacterium]|nr:NUDIX hydrolase [Candidatus Staskawiczbacteria bacterium]
MAQGDANLIEALKKINPFQPYGTELFDALARITVSIAIETVSLRFNNATNKLEVYMVQRSLIDTAYPGEWHSPGSVMRPGESVEDVLDRLAKREFCNPFISIQFVGVINPSKKSPEVRGHFVGLAYLCVFKETNALRGKWFPVDELPEKTVIHHQKRIIPVAVGSFLANTYPY